MTDKHEFIHRTRDGFLFLVQKDLRASWIRVVLSFLTLENYCLNILVPLNLTFTKSLQRRLQFAKSLQRRLHELAEENPNNIGNAASTGLVARDKKGIWAGVIRDPISLLVIGHISLWWGLIYESCWWLPVWLGLRRCWVGYPVPTDCHLTSWILKVLWFFVVS